MRAIPATARHFGWRPSLPAARPILEALGAAVGRAASAVRRWRLISRNIRELSRLDDHLLADIGLHRSEIVASVHRRVAEIERLGRYEYW